MKRFLAAACILFSVYACTKEDNANGLPPALRAMIDSSGNCTCEPFINKYEWREKIVYLFSVKGPACLSTPFFFNEDGTKLSLPGNYTYADFSLEAKFVAKVWECTELKNSN